MVPRTIWQRRPAHAEQVTEVLVDRFAKGRWTGRTRGNTLVHIDGGGDLLGKLVDVRVTATSPWYLIGETVGDPR